MAMELTTSSSTQLEFVVQKNPIDVPLKRRGGRMPHPLPRVAGSSRSHPILFIKKAREAVN